MQLRHKCNNSEKSVIKEKIHLNKILNDSIQNAESDMKARALLEARNEANNVILAAEKFIIQNASILSDEEIETTKSLTERLRVTVAGDDKDVINAAMADLNVYTEPLAHRALDANIMTAMQGKQIV